MTSSHERKAEHK